MEPCSEEGAESSQALGPALCPVVGPTQPKQCLPTPILQMEKLRPREVRGLFQSHTARWRRHSRFRVDLENPWRPEPYFPESPGGWHPSLWPQFSHLGSGLTVATWQSPHEVRRCRPTVGVSCPYSPLPAPREKALTAHPKQGALWWPLVARGHLSSALEQWKSLGHGGEKAPAEGRGRRATGLECPWGSRQGRLRMPPRRELGWILWVAGGYCGCGTGSPGR